MTTDERKISVGELAAAIGVSISTVGRALADDPRISAETKAKVRRAAERAGYVGSMAARVMRGGKSNLMGLLIPDVRNDFYAEIAQALSETCDREGHRLVLSITGDDREVEARHIRELVGARASGIIIVPTANPRRESTSMLRGIAHVQLLRRLDSLGDAWFGINDEPALFEATTHLLERGHRRIAYIGGSESLSTGSARARGFQRAYEQARISLDQATILIGPTTAEYGAAATKQLLARTRAPTAIATGSVHITLGVIEQIEKLHIPVPQDLSVIGFGDPTWFEWWQGGLTTIRPPVQELATTCGLWFLNRIKAGGRNSVVRHSSVANSILIQRATVRRLQNSPGPRGDNRR
jgi:DNA-binding LacI/PurR family transcriptional regulator